MLRLWYSIDFTKLLSSILLFTSLNHAVQAEIGVVYPEVREPYNQIFIALQNGIKANCHENIIQYVLANDTTAEEVVEWVAKHDIEGIIFLGSRGLKIARQLKNVIDRNIVVGGTIIEMSEANKDIKGISMAPAPGPFFLKLTNLFPEVKTVHVIYEPEYDWLIKLAQRDTQKYGIQLNAVLANNIKELATSYQNILKNQKSNTEALWLPYSGRSLERALLNEVLKMAWKNELTVFSSNLADVRKGALFSLYPDNEASGRRLIDMLNQIDSGENPQNVIQLSLDLNAALNTRTAEHLRIHLGSEEKREYKVLFPLNR